MAPQEMLEKTASATPTAERADTTPPSTGGTDATTSATTDHQQEGHAAVHKTDTNLSYSRRFLTGWPLFMVIAGVSVVVVLTLLDLAIIGTAIPQITSDFNRLGDVGWYISAYTLGNAAIQPLSGKMFTYFHLKWTFLLFFLVFEIGSAICGAATSSAMLIAGRAVAGIGGSGLVNGGLTIIMAAAKPERMPLYTGLVMGVGQVGIVAGPLLGGALTQHASWRWCFYINLPLGAVAGALMAFVNVPEQRAKDPFSLALVRRLIPIFDLPGFALLASATVMLLLALQFGAESYGWSAPTVIGLFVGAGVGYIVFALWEWRLGEDAMIPVSILTSRVVWCAGLYMGFLMSSVIVGTNFIPIYLQSVKGLSPTMSGVYMMATVGAQVILIVLSGALVNKSGYYIPWALLAAGGTMIASGLVSTWSRTTAVGPIIGYLLVMGLRGTGFQMPVIAVRMAVSSAQIAMGTSFIVFGQNFMGSIFTTVANAIFQETLTTHIGHIKGVSPEAAIAAGGSADAVRALAPPGPTRNAILDAYADAISDVFLLLIATAGAAFVVAFGMGWYDLRPKKEAEEETKEEPQQTADV
ncbi:major facilitator superfamily domain-containing protein [Emericellopsis atlantica]|uniref:Major facilitator superfamily domain-containing protein n=1 Tax=Emericellopsis atlantica TaxID=2614577 RepID=A0A9P7ZMT7_9HYPO|nr:major facilitator superfamily domain-containing protein [Emericellopsis atlantica]KAG9254373.1 major facilitator superfamily domain-containing protein [Emericellopsis atlantica]